MDFPRSHLASQIWQRFLDFFGEDLLFLESPRIAEFRGLSCPLKLDRISPPQPKQHFFGMKA